MVCKRCKKSDEFEFTNVEFKNHAVHTQSRCKGCGHVYYIKRDHSIKTLVPSGPLKREKGRSISSLYR
jgi:uncharacterized Zn finger protein